MSLPVIVRCDGYPNMELCTGDISATGLFLHCDPQTFPPVGQSIQVQAASPSADGEPAPLLSARIVRATATGVGIEVIDVIDVIDVIE